MAQGKASQIGHKQSPQRTGSKPADGYHEENFGYHEKSTKLNVQAFALFAVFISEAIELPILFVRDSPVVPHDGMNRSIHAPRPTGLLNFGYHEEKKSTKLNVQAFRSSRYL